MSRRKNTVEDVLHSIILREDGCWDTAREPGADGYRQISISGVNWYVHKLVYEVLRGTVPDGLDLDHLCRYRGCCNPDHLEPVTRQINCRRGQTGLNMSSKTHCPKGHPYSDQNTYLYRGSRSCRECGRLKCAAWRERNKG